MRFDKPHAVHDPAEEPLRYIVSLAAACGMAP
jgi:hypothetical protein